eukprot:GCRY01002293.1.p1 GENE.GCRY01002293.1~~GCRY01002293.1.p1  ORF type:complete len:545 (-),score=89.19 GCRY01002293.1:410-2044(-)
MQYQGLSEVEIEERRPRQKEDSPFDTDSFRAKCIKRRRIWYCLGFLFLLAAGGCAIAIALKDSGDDERVNIILMISDGYGPASATFYRGYYGEHASSPLDNILVGTSRTYSGNSIVTDSAAGATAFSCVKKTYNGAIGVDLQGKPCGTILEAASMKGFKTGVVATSSVTNATPAAFSSHVVNRNMEDDIALQQIEMGHLDLILGGGKTYFLSNTTANADTRNDNIDLITIAESRGFSVLTKADDLDVHKQSLPVLGLFAPEHLDYMMDRSPTTSQPTLSQMASFAIEKLNQESDKGFFVVIEGSRIDHAAHDNDPAAHLHEITEYQKTVASVLGWAKDRANTLVISVSDHETGGLTLGRQVGNETSTPYAWYPEVLSPIDASIFKMMNLLMDSSAPAFSVLSDILKTHANITDITPEEEQALTKSISCAVNPTSSPDERKACRSDTSDGVSGIISARSRLGWAGHMHTGVDVNLYASGLKSDRLRGNHENTDIGELIRSMVGGNLAETTTKITKALGTLSSSRGGSERRTVETTPIDLDRHWRH